jgi:hypothetical protein
MERKTPVNRTNSYTTIQDYFLAQWVSTIGLGPTVLYIQLLSYCHKGKDTAWPSIKTLNKRLGTTTKTLIRYRNILLEYGLIKKVECIPCIQALVDNIFFASFLPTILGSSKKSFGTPRGNANSVIFPKALPCLPCLP